MNTESKKQPLYKVLNEQRTQGKWDQDQILGGTFGYEVVDNSGNTIGDFLKNSYYRKRPNGEGRKIGQANAQYTALAVNNLNTIAEALERIVNGGLDNLGKYADNKEVDFKSICGAMVETAQKALAAIS